MTAPQPLSSLSLGSGLLCPKFQPLLPQLPPSTVASALCRIQELSYSPPGPCPVLAALLSRLAAGDSHLCILNIFEADISSLPAVTVAAALVGLASLELPQANITQEQIVEVLRCLASPQSRVRRLRVELASLAWANPGLVARAVANVKEVHLDCFLPSSHLQALYTALVAGAPLRSLHLGRKNDMRRLPLGHLRRMLNLLNCQDVCSVLRRWEGAVILVQAQGPLVQGREVDGRDKGQWDEFFRVRRKRLIL